MWLLFIFKYSKQKKQRVIDISKNSKLQQQIQYHAQLDYSKTYYRAETS